MLKQIKEIHGRITRDFSSVITPPTTAQLKSRRQISDYLDHTKADLQRILDGDMSETSQQGQDQTNATTTADLVDANMSTSSCEEDDDEKDNLSAKDETNVSRFKPLSSGPKVLAGVEVSEEVTKWDRS